MVAPITSTHSCHLVKRNLTLLTTGSTTADFVIITGSKCFHVHKYIVKAISPDFYEHLLSRSDPQLKRLDLTGESGPIAFGNMMKYVYTFDYDFTDMDTNITPFRTGRLLCKHILANLVGKKFVCERYAEAARVAFVQMRMGPMLWCKGPQDTPYKLDEEQRKKNDEIVWSWLAGAKLIVGKGVRLDPVFETWCVNWLVTGVSYVPKDAKYFWDALSGPLKPLTTKAKLRKMSDGPWE